MCVEAPETEGACVTRTTCDWIDLVKDSSFVLSKSTGNVRMKDTLKKEFWDNVFEKTDFAQHIEQRYKVAYKSILGEDASE